MIYLIDQTCHVHAVFDGLIQNEGNLRSIAQVHRFSELGSDIANRILQTAYGCLRLFLCRCV